MDAEIRAVVAGLAESANAAFSRPAIGKPAQKTEGRNGFLKTDRIDAIVRRIIPQGGIVSSNLTLATNF